MEHSIRGQSQEGSPVGVVQPQKPGVEQALQEHSESRGVREEGVWRRRSELAGLLDGAAASSSAASDAPEVALRKKPASRLQRSRGFSEHWPSSTGHPQSQGRTGEPLVTIGSRPSRRASGGSQHPLRSRCFGRGAQGQVGRPSQGSRFVFTNKGPDELDFVRPRRWDGEFATKM